VIQFVSPVIPLPQIVLELLRPVRAWQFPPLAMLLLVDANCGCVRARRDARAVVRHPDFAAARKASIPWVVDKTFLRRA
jgi:hypothetical protein